MLRALLGGRLLLKSLLDTSRLLSCRGVPAVLRLCQDAILTCFRARSHHTAEMDQL